MVAFVPGRKPPHPDDAAHPRLRLGDYLTAALPAPSAAVDWYSLVGSWPMYGNDTIGDCTEAMVAHAIEAAADYGTGTPALITDQDVLTAYERVSGYVPGDPSTDNGAVLQDVYGDWARNGVGGHKALAFAQVDHTSQLQLRQAIDLFGSAGLGIVVTQDMIDAFNAGMPWTTASGAELGGHAVPAVGYDAQCVYVVTWAKIQAISWGCLQAVLEEAWCAILPEWFSSTGVDPTGLDLYQLGQDLHDLTGADNPFPPPAPPPSPVPPSPIPAPPTPVPAPDAADETLAAAARGWLEFHHVGPNARFAKAVAAWLHVKDLAAEPALEE